MTGLLLIHLAVTLTMVGIIWSVQWVQYPLFVQVGYREFADYHRTHVRRIGQIVMPLMIVEAVTGLALIWAPSGVSPLALTACFLLLVAVWISTFMVQVPLHRELSYTGATTIRQKLVLSNWIRTIAWTAKALILLLHWPAVH